MPTTITVTDAASLKAAIATADNAAAGAGEFDIVFGGNITLSAATELYAFNLKGGNTVQVQGGGFTLNGGGVTRGFFDYAGAVGISNLTISNAVAAGGAGGAGRRGAGRCARRAAAPAAGARGCRPSARPIGRGAQVAAGEHRLGAEHLQPHLRRSRRGSPQQPCSPRSRRGWSRRAPIQFQASRPTPTLRP